MKHSARLVAGILLAGGLTLGIGATAFASSGTPDPTTTVASDAPAKGAKVDCANVAAFDTAAHARLDKVNARIAKLVELQTSHAAGLAKHPAKATKLQNRIDKLHTVAERITARIARVDARCANPAAPGGAATA